MESIEKQTIQSFFQQQEKYLNIEHDNVVWNILKKLLMKFFCSQIYSLFLNQHRSEVIKFIQRINPTITEKDLVKSHILIDNSGNLSDCPNKNLEDLENQFIFNSFFSLILEIWEYFEFYKKFAEIQNVFKNDEIAKAEDDKNIIKNIIKNNLRLIKKENCLLKVLIDEYDFHFHLKNKESTKNNFSKQRDFIAQIYSHMGNIKKYISEILFNIENICRIIHEEQQKRSVNFLWNFIEFFSGFFIIKKLSVLLLRGAINGYLSISEIKGLEMCVDEMKKIENVRKFLVKKYDNVCKLIEDIKNVEPQSEDDLEKNEIFKNKVKEFIALVNINFDNLTAEYNK